MASETSDLVTSAELSAESTHHHLKEADQPIITLQNPMNPSSQGKEPLVCPGCGRQFSRRASMRRHYQGVHLNMKPYTCDVCNCQYRTDRRSNLRRHLKKVHGINSAEPMKTAQVMNLGFFPPASTQGRSQLPPIVSTSTSQSSTSFHPPKQEPNLQLPSQLPPGLIKSEPAHLDAVCGELGSDLDAIEPMGALDLSNCNLGEYFESHGLGVESNITNHHPDIFETDEDRKRFTDLATSGYEDSNRSYLGSFSNLASSIFGAPTTAFPENRDFFTQSETASLLQSLIGL